MHPKFSRKRKVGLLEMADQAEQEARHIEFIEKSFRPDDPNEDRIRKMEAFYEISKFILRIHKNRDVIRSALIRSEEAEMAANQPRSDQDD